MKRKWIQALICASIALAFLIGTGMQPAPPLSLSAAEVHGIDVIGPPSQWSRQDLEVAFQAIEEHSVDVSPQAYLPYLVKFRRMLESDQDQFTLTASQVFDLFYACTVAAVDYEERLQDWIKYGCDMTDSGRGSIWMTNIRPYPTVYLN